MSFSDPEENIKQFKLGEGMKVADLGSGPGFYAISAARAVGDEGKVYAVDVQKELLKKVKSVADEEGVENIELIWGDLETANGSTLKEESVDAVIVSNILFQMENKEGLLKEAFRILKPKGKLLFVDWADSFGGLGPPEESIVTETEAKGLFEQAGFSFYEKISAGEHHHGAIFRKMG